MIDNYSCKIFSWAVCARFDPSSTCQLLLAAGKHLVSAGRPILYADSGVENVNSAVDSTLSSACLERILAQVDVAFSNSMIESFWRSLKHQWLFINSLESIERLRTLAVFYIEQHNTQMPHPAFDGQTPEEMYFGTAADLGETGSSAGRGTRRSSCRQPRAVLRPLRGSADQPGANSPGG